MPDDSSADSSADSAANPRVSGRQSGKGVRLPTVVVLASGRGERFRASGGQVHKLQALLAGRPVLERTLDAVRGSGLSWHLEDAGHPGMGDSIAAAVRACTDADGWLILPADLPLVRAETLRQIGQRLHEWSTLAGPRCAVTPRHQGGRGHPVGFGSGCRAELLALAGNQGAAPVLQAMSATNLIANWMTDDPGVAIDIDTVADLQRAERLWAAR